MSKITKILIVGDQLSLREYIKVILDDKYAVDTANGTEEALEYMTHYPFGLVLLDFRMTKTDGIIALREIKKRYPETEVILITAYTSLETIQKAMKLGAFGFIMKPFDTDILLNTVDEALKSWVLSNSY